VISEVQWVISVVGVGLSASSSLASRRKSGWNSRGHRGLDSEGLVGARGVVSGGVILPTGGEVWDGAKPSPEKKILFT